MSLDQEERLVAPEELGAAAIKDRAHSLEFGELGEQVASCSNFFRFGEWIAIFKKSRCSLELLTGPSAVQEAKGLNASSLSEYNWVLLELQDSELGQEEEQRRRAELELCHFALTSVSSLSAAIADLAAASFFERRVRLIPESLSKIPTPFRNSRMFSMPF